MLGRGKDAFHLRDAGQGELLYEGIGRFREGATQGDEERKPRGAFECDISCSATGTSVCSDALYAICSDLVCILQALAVHPDYLTRNSILQEMKERWLDLSQDGVQSVALGLLRDGQYEMALDKLDYMVSHRVETPPWFLDIFVYVLAQVGFHDEALKIVSHRVLKENDSISLNLWYFLLDSCSRSMHYPGVKYVWNRMVEPKILNPPDAMFLNILNTAARYRDSQLVAEAIQLMSARGTKLGMHHFEALLDAYAGADDVANALQALCIMENAGVRPDRGSTRSLFQSLKRAPALTESAVSSLFSLRERFKIPLAAFNVVVEGILERGDMDTALNLYRHVRQLCPEGPDATTFHILTQKCSEPKLVDFLGRECASFNIKPTPETCNHVIYHSAKRGSLELALDYASILVSGGALPAGNGAAPWMEDVAAEALVRRCFEEEDHRIWDVAQASKEGGRPMDHIIQYVLKDFPHERWQSPPEQAQPVVTEETARASV